jgi:predicted aspartyl protease
MPTQIGYIDQRGHPRLTIRVEGTNPSASADVEAMIDTGFTGFLMLPLAVALPLGLALYGTGDYTLADGTPVTQFLAQGKVTVLAPSQPTLIGAVPTSLSELETTEGMIVLGGDGALVGMEFIRSLKKWLIVGRMVALFDEPAIAVPTPPGSPVVSPPKQ